MKDFTPDTCAFVNRIWGYDVVVNANGIGDVYCGDHFLYHVRLV